MQSYCMYNMHCLVGVVSFCTTFFTMYVTGFWKTTQIACQVSKYVQCQRILSVVPREVNTSHMCEICTIYYLYVYRSLPVLLAVCLISHQI